MGRATLSHRAFRDNHPARPPSDEYPLERFGSDLSRESLTFTRREMVALTGTLALAASAGVNATASALSQATVTADRRSLRVSMAGRTFRLDAWWFGPSARLNVVRTASTVSVSLTSATYPGTDIPADLTMRFTSLEGSTRVQIRSAAFGFNATVPLLAWLEGRAKARSRVSLEAIRSAVGDGYHVRLAGTAQAVLHPDLTFDLSGADVASLKGPRVELSGDEAHLWLASDATPTTLTRRIKLRTFVQIRGRTADWKVEGVATAGGNAVDFGADSFDQATIEAAQTRSGDRVAVVTFENSAESGNASMRFPAGMGSTLASLLPLGNPRYGLVCGDGERFSIIADIADASSWLHRPGHSLLVGRSVNHPRIELNGAGRTAQKTDVQTELLGIAVPIDGVIASPIMFHTSAAVEGDTAKPAVLESARAFSPEVAPLALPPGYEVDAGWVKITRPDDMLALKLEFYNLRLLLDPPRLVRKPGSPAYLVVEFPPQSLLEQAYYAESGGFGQLITWLNNQKSPPIKARIAGPTRLAFAIPNTLADEGIKYTLDGLLTWLTFTQSVAPAAREPVELLRGRLAPSGWRPPKKGAHYPLVPPETILEAPWGVYLSPSERKEYWRHRLLPFTSGAGVTELWHTTLTGRTYYIKNNPTAYRYKPGVRVVWARGYRWEADPNLDFRNSFTTRGVEDPYGTMNRSSLVDITSIYQHDRVAANRLTLTALGAWLDLKGQWPTDEYLITEDISSSLLAWDHRATMGRDQYVRIVEAGRLFPFGHKAAKITITERKFENAPDGKRTAYLKQRSFIVIRELDKTFQFGNTARNRQTPFRRVTFKTRVTPGLMADVDTMVRDPEYDLTTKTAFWPTVLVTGKLFNFEYTVTDWDGRTSEVSSPLIFIDERWAVKVATPPAAQLGHALEIRTCDRAMADMEISLNGQKIAFSEGLGASPPTDPVTGAPKDRRVLQTESMRLRVENVVTTAWSTAGAIYFYPRLYRAKVRLEDVEAIMGTNAGTWISLWSTYIATGYAGGNAVGRVFAEISDSGSISTPPPAGGLALNVPPDKTGGFATPSLAVKGLSASEGAFGGDPTSFGTGTIEATNAAGTGFFDQMNPKLFGDIRLLDILQGVALVLGDGDVPNFNDYIRTDEFGNKFARYDYKWATEKFGTSEFFEAWTSPRPKAQLSLNAYLEKNLTDITAAPQAGMSGGLTNFSLKFVVIEVLFNYFNFSVDSKGNVDVDPGIKDIRFYNELEFINQLRELMNFTSDGGGFALDVTGEGVSAIITIALPDIAVGIFSLKNMAITAGIKIPFDGTPVRFPFSFCTREKPFELAVSGFGGGGYFLVELQASDQYPVAVIEFSLEFGVCASISLCGIASGSVEIKGGVMMRFEMGALTFTAFFRMAGRLDILGIIVVAVTFELTLTYMNKQAAGGPNEILIGEAKLTIDIEILFFSFSVTLTVTKQFEGDDPRFGEWMDATDWDSYCKAFGPATVGA